MRMGAWKDRLHAMFHKYISINIAGLTRCRLAVVCPGNTTGDLIDYTGLGDSGEGRLMGQGGVLIPLVFA